MFLRTAAMLLLYLPHTHKHNHTHKKHTHKHTRTKTHTHKHKYIHTNTHTHTHKSYTLIKCLLETTRTISGHWINGQSATPCSAVRAVAMYSVTTVINNMFLVNNQLDAQFFPYIFISILYMFRANMCSSSGDQLFQYDIRYTSLYVGDRLVCRYAYLHTRRLPTSSDIYQMSYWNNWSPDDEHMVARNM